MRQRMAAENARLNPTIHWTQAQVGLGGEVLGQLLAERGGHRLGLVVREAGGLELSRETKRVDRGGGHGLSWRRIDTLP